MTDAAINPILEIGVKIGLVALGALFGAALTAYVARLKLRRLLHSLLRQIRATAKVAQAAFSPEEAALCVPQLESAARLLQDLISAGVKGADWNAGLACLENARLAASRAASTSPEDAVVPTSALRGEAASLTNWLSTVA
jgi:hypothetical protein